MFGLKPCLDWNCINSFADWVSAIGTIFISGVSLWLAYKDRLIRIDGAFDVGMIPSDTYNNNILDRNVFILSFVNIGRRKVKIENFKICLKVGLFKKNYAYLFPQYEASLKLINPQFPIRLDEMEKANVFFDENFFINLQFNNNQHIFHKNTLITWYRLKTAYFLLDTSIGEQIKIRINQDAIDKLWKQYKSIWKIETENGDRLN